MSQPSSLVGRALIALALTIGFYMLALGLSVGLILAAYLSWDSTGSANVRIAIFCIVSALLILYSVVPRIDRFVAPGPRLIEDDHPALFDLIRKVAGSTGQSMPAEVYLVPDLNAWVANRGGILGIGSRRVMGLGLPAFQALTLRQFAAVIAHEFGHYHHGDVALGPWLYRVRQGIARTLQALEEHNNVFLILFNWYGELFVRVTTAISRRQEYGADALAARLMGRQALSSGLETIHATSPIYEGYWGTEIMPVLVSGKRPRIADGFRRFTASSRIREVAESMLKAAMEAPEDPYDTHPALSKRLEALAQLPDQGTLQLPDSDSAISLLGSTDAAEAALLVHLITDEAHRPAQAVEWNQVGEAVWVPIWKARVDEGRDKIAGIRCADAAAIAVDSKYLAVRMRFAARASVTSDQHRHEAALLFASALTLILLDRGGTLELAIGDDPVIHYRGTDLKPFLICSDLENGTVTPSEWLSTCERLDIASVDLADATPLAVAAS